MVTKVGERGQVGIRGASVTDEWEQLVKFAAKRNGQNFADFIVDTTRAAALIIVKHQRPDDTPGDTPDDAESPAVSSTLPIRLEDIAADLTDRLAQIAGGQADGMARLEAAQAERIARLEATQTERLARIERQARRGRWRR